MAELPLKHEGVEDENVHLFLFVHGLWGNPNHMSTIEKAVKKSLAPVSPERIVTIKPSSFRFWKTYDGIQRCAENTIADLFYEIETLKLKNKSHVTKISIIGYSLGGLISRYVVGSLYELGFFEEVSPVFFTTFATPHIGVHFFKDAAFYKIANGMGKRLFGKTGFQLFLGDSKSLLVDMTRPESCYIKGLRLFEKRILLANIKNDRTVPFYTSFITDYSPFDSLNSINIQYFEGTPPAKVNGITVWPKFVDLHRSYKINSPDVRHRNVQEATSILRSNSIIRYTLLLFAALVLFPFYLPLIICLSFYVSGYSILKVNITSGPDIVGHWAAVRQSVFHGGPVDTEHVEQGDSRRQQRKKLSRHESFKGDTSTLTENAMEKMLAAEERFANDPAEMIEEGYADDDDDDDDDDDKDGKPLSGAQQKEPLKNSEENQHPWASTSDDSSSDGESSERTDVEKRQKSLLPIILKRKTKIEIPYSAYDEAIKRNKGLLSMNNSTKIPLFEEKVRLPFSKDQLTIINNLNELGWIKIAVFHDSFNAHDSIVARRGDIRNPKGTCTIFFWASILRNHVLENEAD
ncbi:hypothetical protein JCM33374_g531 [Metschnikowia sp. JCM 33374]|nr:hypothetical protein JCM33374_g531 [Metschnikowia sp. JCM 33374]